MQKGRIDLLSGRQAVLNERRGQNGIDVKICRAIAHSQSNELTVKEIIKLVGSNNNSIYRNINRLASQSGEIWSTGYLFCSTLINDLVGKVKNNDNVEIDSAAAQRRLGEEIEKIAHKLESLYYNYDSERVKLIPRIESDDDDNKNIIIFENDKCACAKITLDKSAAKIKDSAVLTIGNRNIPLTWIHKGHGLYFKPLLSASTKVKGELDYLRCMTSNKGLRKIYEHRKRIAKISNSKRTSDERKDRLIHDFLYKIRKIYDDIRYRKLSMTTKSLLLYASKEDDYTEFNKSIECLSNSKSDLIHEKLMVKEFNEFGEENNGTCHPFVFKQDFPYLSKYALVKDHLPPNFITRLLKKIALELKDKLQDMNGEEINYKVTNQFLEHVRKCIPDNSGVNKNTHKHIDDYLNEIGVFVRYIDLRENEMRKRRENRKSIYDKENDLRQTLVRFIKNSIGKKKEVIPIYKQTQQAKVLWDSERHILDLIENKYGRRYLVTPTCLVRKYKVRKLRALLRGKPTPQKANSLLIEKGHIPRECLNYPFLTKLGFCIDSKRPGYTDPFVAEIKKNRSARE